MLSGWYAEVSLRSDARTFRLAARCPQLKTPWFIFFLLLARSRAGRFGFFPHSAIACRLCVASERTPLPWTTTGVQGGVSLNPKLHPRSSVAASCSASHRMPRFNPLYAEATSSVVIPIYRLVIRKSLCPSISCKSSSVSTLWSLSAWAISWYPKVLRRVWVPALQGILREETNTVLIGWMRLPVCQ